MEVDDLELRFSRKFPKLVKSWIQKYGAILVDSPAKGDPFLYFLGTGKYTSEYIELFNYVNNPTRPDNLIIIVHKFDGEHDIYYALNEKNKIYYLVSTYAPVFVGNQDEYPPPNWQFAFESVEELWENRLKVYLNTQSEE